MRDYRFMLSRLVGVYRGDHLVHTGRVGTGFNQRNAGGILKKLAALASNTSPFGGKGAPRKAHDVTWVEPKLIAEMLKTDAQYGDAQSGPPIMTRNGAVACGQASREAIVVAAVSAGLYSSKRPRNKVRHGFDRVSCHRLRIA